MAKQIVLCHNKVLAHGEDCFIYMGHTVINKSSGETYQNSTICEITCDIPYDITENTYEYYFGEFVPVNTSNVESSIESTHAVSADKLTNTTAIGSTTKPVYFNASGSPVAIDYEVAAKIKSFLGSLATGGWKTLGARENGPLVSVAYNNNAAGWNSGTYSSSLVFGAGDTKGLVDCSHTQPIVTFGGGSVGSSSDDSPTWYMSLKGITGKTYTFPDDSCTLATSTHNHDSVYQAKGSYASASHTHTKSQITDFPTSMTPTAHNQASNTITAMTGYSKPSATAAIAATDSLNSAIGKLEKALDGKQASGSYASSTHNHDSVYQAKGSYAAASHTHNYAGSSSAGGAATSANKINTDAGSATQPVYFSNGVPVATTYSLGKSVPSNAVFTDTNTWRPLGTTADTACAGNDSRLSDARTPLSHTHSYAGSSSAGGAATSAISAATTTPGTASLKNIQMSTTDLTAGTSALTTGTVYIVYE